VLVCPHSLDAAVSSSYASPPETRGASFPNTLPSFEDTKRVGFQCPYIHHYSYSTRLFVFVCCVRLFMCRSEYAHDYSRTGLVHTHACESERASNDESTTSRETHTAAALV
jgi:hypothetical protein